MSNYEVLYIISPKLSEEEREGLINKFKGYVEQNKGTVSGIDKWGLKPLAYRIKFQNEGYYILMTYSLDKDASTSMGKLMLITEGILRHIIVKK